MLKTRVFILFIAFLFAGAAAVANPESDQTRVYKVDGMTCGLCSKAIEKSVGQVEGVKSVDVDRDAERVTVTAASTVEPDSLILAIESAGSFTAMRLND